MAFVINRDDLPHSGTSHQFEGYLNGNVPVCILLSDLPAGSGPRLHSHPYAEIFIVQEGCASFTVDAETIEVTGGQIVVAPAGVPHKFINTGPGYLRQISIQANDRFVVEWLED